jgi:Ni/Co efflux regulator RcnB
MEYMKKSVSLIAAVVMCMAAMVAQAQETSRQQERAERKSERDAERAKIKAEEQAEQMASYQEAIQAIKDNKFVLEADQATFVTGESMYVNSSTNFVLVNGEKSTVQTAFNSVNPGPNGLGGVTLEGTVSGAQMSMDKQGNISYSFSVQGIAISAQVFISMAEGNNNATVTINPNFNPNTLTLTGNIVPLQQSDIFKANPL